MLSGVWGEPRPSDGDSTKTVVKYKGSVHPLLLQKKGRPTWERMVRIPVNMIEFPLSIMGKGLEETLHFIERTQLISRAQRLPERLLQHHILVDDDSQGDGSGMGATFGLIGSIKPIQISASSSLTVRTYQRHLLQLRYPGFMVPQGELSVWAQYRVRPREHFYGLGPGTSRDLHTRFQQSNLNTGMAFSYQTDRFQISGLMDWTDYDKIEKATGTACTPTHEQFPDLPGLNGVTLLGVGVKITCPRELYLGKPAPEQGFELSAHTYRDMNDGNYGFHRYTLTLYQTVPIFWEDRVLALRLMGSMTDPRRNKRIPFFALNHMGGSSTLRSYNNLRFWDRDAVLFNVEYRYLIWDIGTQNELAMDAVWFFDTGMVFHAMEDDFAFHKLVSDYGAGFRVRTNLGTSLRLNISHGSETTRIGFKLGKDF